MADPFGFLKYPRKDNPYRPVEERIQDWEELQTPLDVGERKEQAARCMNCGIPFAIPGFSMVANGLSQGVPMTT